MSPGLHFALEILGLPANAYLDSLHAKPRFLTSKNAKKQRHKEAKKINQVRPANEYLQDEKGHHLSAVNSPCGGLFEFLALKGLHRVAQGQ